MWRAPLRAYSVFGCTSAPASETPPEQERYSRWYAENHESARHFFGHRVAMPRAHVEIEGRCDQPRRDEPQRRLRRGARSTAAESAPGQQEDGQQNQAAADDHDGVHLDPQVNARVLTACQAG